MTKASFYILSEQNPLTQEKKQTTYKIWHVAYRLCKKAMHTGSITLLCDTDQCSTLSDFLWSQQADEFFAHSVHGDNFINISDNIDTITTDIIINLSTQTLLQQNSKRILEIVATDEPSKLKSRERYTAYRKAGFELENFQILI